jgi:hypothetical protein
MTAKVTIYQEYNFKGETVSFQNSQKELPANFENTSSSINFSIDGGDGYLVAYTKKDYGSIGHLIKPGEYKDHNKLGIPNDSLSSFQIIDGEGIYVFPELNFQGEAIFTPDDPNAVNIQNGHTIDGKSAIVMSGVWSKTAGEPTYLLSGHTYPQLNTATIKRASHGKLSIKSNQLQTDTLTQTDTITIKEVSTITRSYLTLEILMDVSGSMSLPISTSNKEIKLNVAKESLTKIAEEMPIDVYFALRAFGTNSGDTVNIGSTQAMYSQLMFPRQKMTEARKKDLMDKIKQIEAQGWTPIAGTLQKVKSDMGDAEGNIVVVLITDGEANGGGDVLEEIKKLRASGIDVKINVVGFAIDDQTLRNQFAEWAQAGGGDYYDATNVKEFINAVRTSILPKYIVYNENMDKIAEGFVDGPAIDVPSGSQISVKVQNHDEFLFKKNLTIEPEKEFVKNIEVQYS